MGNDIRCILDIAAFRTTAQIIIAMHGKMLSANAGRVPASNQMKISPIKYARLIHSARILPCLAPLVCTFAAEKVAGGCFGHLR